MAPIKECAPDKNQKSLAGEYAVLSQLALRGYDACMTLGHTKNIDILIYNPKSKKYSKMEVKTADYNKEARSADFGRTYDWSYMNEKHEKISDPDLFYCFVLLGGDVTKFRFFIVPGETVANYVKKQHVFWLMGEPRRGKTRKDTRRRTFRLGFKGERYNLSTPLAEEYENRWDLLC